MPLCVIDLREAFDTVETEAVIEALSNQCVPTQFIRMLRDIVPITPHIERAERMLAEEIRSSELRRRTKIRDAVDYAKKSNIRWAGHVMRYSLTVGPGRLLFGSLGTSTKHQDSRQRDGQTSSRKPELNEC
ncbi:hypothetical protein V3C99_017958 [Haemonchus contortus]|uniref:Reverse transcriptase domain-containing protein n=1 Tax=Haemonchus contortus TaxID=6289 RepID=A0A7I4Z2W8_HAECO